MKKTLLIIIALLTVLTLVLGACTPAAEDEAGGTQLAEKHFTVIVVHRDGTQRTFNYSTTEEKLGPVLVQNGLIGESDSPGMYTTIDGETADWNVDKSYWSFYVGGDYALKGMDDTTIKNGDVFKLVYTLG